MSALSLIIDCGGAFSAFRLQATRRVLAAQADWRGEVTARRIAFCRSSPTLAGADIERLAAVVGGRPGRPEVPGADLYLVTPLPGSISPWSSKADEILRRCGLAAATPLEQGVAWFLSADQGAADPDQAAAIAALLHDRMTETVWRHWEDLSLLSKPASPRPLRHIPRAELVQANREMGLALSAVEIEYLASLYGQAGRDPTDAELMMFAQINSEHCRHKLFNADWRIDGQARAESLFAMIRDTHRRSPEGTLVAYDDNAAVIQGHAAEVLCPDSAGEYRYRASEQHLLIKVETHNHPTAIAPLPGAAPGAGGEIRDEGATGRGGKPKAGSCGFTVSNLRIPGGEQPWEQDHGRPERIVSALQIMLEGPIGAAAFNNEFGRPNLAGYFRTYEQAVGDRVFGYHKPIMLAGGMGNVQHGQVHKRQGSPGDLVIQLGGPGMLIGLGGGAASSMQAGANEDELDFNSVQRHNPEMQRRCQEVIDHCWRLGGDNPIISIHDVGAGGLCNAVPELVHASGCGAALSLQAIPSADASLSPMELWCNEAQERYVLLVAAGQREAFMAVCRRESCPAAVLGELTAEPRLLLRDEGTGDRVVDMALPALLGKLPIEGREASRLPNPLTPVDLDGIDLPEAVARVLQMPAVADKRFLITIGDRSVGGLVARDQLVGPWQVAVADCAVTSADFKSRAGEAMALGERTPVAVLDSAAAARLAVGEAITNLLAADVAALNHIKLSANWMAAAGEPGQDADLYAAVEALGKSLCPALGISIPVGKDSLSMKTRWRGEDGAARSVVSPVSLVVTAFAAVADAAATLTPQLHLGEPSELLLVDLGGGRNRLGGSCLAQAWGVTGDEPADLEQPAHLLALAGWLRALRDQGLLLAYHDRSDGGLLVTLLEMAFASRCGLTVTLPGMTGPALLGQLFSEELGVVVQVPRRALDRCLALAETAGLAGLVSPVGRPDTTSRRITIAAGDVTRYSADAGQLQQLWGSTSHALQRLRDNPGCADAEQQVAVADDPGLRAELTFPLPKAPAIVGTQRPRVAVLREQGVNGQLEMAAAFERAGFTAVDLPMAALMERPGGLADFQGIAACGGFSFGDVTGAGRGWANSIRFNPALRDAFSAFFERPDSFGLGVCNGCQMMAQLRDLIPGADHWPDFLRNESEQFEARLSLVRIEASPSVLLQGMAGSLLPVVVSHGEGRVPAGASLSGLALRYVDNFGAPTEAYPYNPNGSLEGAAGYSNRDGRFTIMMPHPERVFRTVQHAWHPPEWGEDGPWLQLFLNARRNVTAS